MQNEFVHAKFYLCADYVSITIMIFYWICFNNLIIVDILLDLF